MLRHLQNTRQLASTFIPYRKEVSTVSTRPIQVLEEHILHVGILLQLTYHVTPKAVSFERSLEQKKALQQVQTLVEHDESKLCHLGHMLQET